MADDNELDCREQTIAREAFMTGRIYTHGGEKEDPRGIERKLFANCVQAVKDHPRQSPTSREALEKLRKHNEGYAPKIKTYTKVVIEGLDAALEGEKT